MRRGNGEDAMKSMPIACVSFLGAIVLFQHANAEEVESEINLVVSANPPLPARNLIVNPSFEDGTKGYKANAGAEIVTDAFTGNRAAKINRGAHVCQNSRPHGPLEPPVPGKAYITSVMVKLSKKHRSGVYGGGIGGNFALNYRLKDRAEQIGQSAPVRRSYKEGDTAGWTKAVSKPLSVSKDAISTYASVDMTDSCGFCKEPGIIDDVFFGEAYSDLTVKAESPNGIYQVTVTNDMGKRIYDSGKLKDKPKTFEKTLTVLTPYVYKVRAMDYEGDLKMVEYPGETTPPVKNPLGVEMDKIQDE